MVKAFANVVSKYPNIMPSSFCKKSTASAIGLSSSTYSSKYATSLSKINSAPSLWHNCWSLDLCRKMSSMESNDEFYLVTTGYFSCTPKVETISSDDFGLFILLQIALHFLKICVEVSNKNYIKHKIYIDVIAYKFFYL